MPWAKAWRRTNGSWLSPLMDTMLSLFQHVAPLQAGRAQAALCISELGVRAVGQPRLTAGTRCPVGQGCRPGRPAAAGSLHHGLRLPAPLGLTDLVQLILEVWGAFSFQPFPLILLLVSLLCFSCCCSGYSYTISPSAKTAPERAGALGSLCTLSPEPAVPTITSHFKALPLPAPPGCWGGWIPTTCSPLARARKAASGLWLER